MTTLPSIGTAVQLEVEDFASPLASRIEDAEGRLLKLSLPAADGAVVTLAAGRQLRLSWRSEHGMLEVAAVVRGRADEKIPLLALEATDEPRRLQRRDHVRATLLGSVFLLTPGGAQAHEEPIATTLNVSGAGMLVRVAATLDPATELRVRLRFGDNRPFDVIARPVRTTDDGAIGFCFIDFAGPEKERLIKLVFAEHRREHAAAKHTRAA